MHASNVECKLRTEAASDAIRKNERYRKQNIDAVEEQFFTRNAAKNAHAKVVAEKDEQLVALTRKVTNMQQ